MAITASRTTLGMDREVARESASSRGRASLLRKGLRQAKKEKNYEKALQFAAGLEGEGQAYGMTGSADDVSSISRGRIASREALVNQMRSQMPAMAGRSREGNIAAAKSAGTFNATREQFNTANAGKKVMDEEGNISDAPAPTVVPPTTDTATPPATDVKPEVKVIPAGKAETMTPRQKLAAAFNEGRISGTDAEDEKKIIEMSSDGVMQTPDKKQEKRARLLAKGRSMATPLTRTRPGLPSFRTM